MPRAETADWEAGPGRLGQVIRWDPHTGKRHLDSMVWGLLPRGSPVSKGAPRLTHARAETVHKLPLFAGAFQHRRAIAPAAEYYQRRTIGKPEQRLAIARRHGKPLAIAALWDASRQPNGDILRSYCILTIPAAGRIAGIHDRMPLVLEEADWPVWLGEVPGDLMDLLRPLSDDVLILRPTPRRPSPRGAARV